MSREERGVMAAKECDGWEGGDYRRGLKCSGFTGAR
jgi:hypothetical protein